MNQENNNLNSNNFNEQDNNEMINNELFQNNQSETIHNYQQSINNSSNIYNNMINKVESQTLIQKNGEPANNDMTSRKSKNKKKLLLAIILIIFLILMIVGVIFLFNNNNKMKLENDKIQTINEKNQLWVDFNNGLVSIDEYVKYNLYNNYDKDLLPKKYSSIPSIEIDNFISKYYSQLSKETIELYVNYYSLPNISFKSNTETNKTALSNFFIENVYAQTKKTTNLNKVYLSSNKNFLLWYTTDGESSVKYSDVQKYGELLESVVEKYNSIFNVNYSFRSSVFSKRGRYQDQLKILSSNGIEEKYMTQAMHVYMYDFNNNDLAGVYHSIDESNNTLVNFINNYFYDSEDGTIITPYISLNTSFINNKSSNFEDTIAHEMYHHYQNYIINNKGSRNSVSDILIGEATSQWAASKITKNKLKNNGLNLSARNYIRHTGDIFTEMYNSFGDRVGYALSRFLYSYENNVENGNQKILNSIHASDGLKYLNDNSTKEEKNNVMMDLSLKNLNNDYPNNNYIPLNNEFVRIKKDIVDGTTTSDTLTLSKMGIDYYSFNSNLKNNYEIKISSIGNDKIGVYVILQKEGEYKIVSSKTNIVNNFYINTKNYSNFEMGYIVVTNSNFERSHLYKIDIKSSELSTYNQKWGTSTPIPFKDKKLGSIGITTKGDCSYVITEAGIDPNSDSIRKQVVYASVGAFQNAIIDVSKDDFDTITRSKNVMETKMLEAANNLVGYGIKITNINISSIDYVEGVKN